MKKPVLNLLASLHALVLLLGCGAVAAQTPIAGKFDPSPNYSYAAFIGTGLYKLDDRQVFIARIQPSWQWREANHDSGSIGGRLLLPISIGLTNFDSFVDLPELELDDLATVSFVPGVELEYYAGPNWSLKPFVQGGWGLELDDNRSTRVWGAGIRTRWTRPRPSSAWVLGGELMVAGNSQPDGPATRFSRIGLGAEYQFEKRWKIWGKSTSLHAQLIGYEYLEKPAFSSPTGEVVTFDWTLTAGLSVGFEPEIRILGLPIDRLGLGYKVGNELSAITLVTGFPF